MSYMDAKASERNAYVDKQIYEQRFAVHYTDSSNEVALQLTASKEHNSCMLWSQDMRMS